MITFHRDRERLARGQPHDAVELPVTKDRIDKLVAG